MIDALRGAALFGVLLVNMMWFAGIDSAVSPLQLAALPTAALDARVDDFIDLLVSAKAIGVFSFLFGVGFAMQLESLERRGVAPRRRYARRLTGLLILGLIHWLAIWSGEILHVYALAGFVMLLLTGIRTRWLVVVGLALAVLARPLAGRLYLLTGGDGSLLTPAMDEIIMATRLQVFTHGSFADAIALQFRQDIPWQLTSGSALAAVLHALGRFMVGMAVARQGYLRNPAAHARGAALLAAITLPLGFVLEHDWTILDLLRDLGWMPSALAVEIFEHLCASVGVVCMTAGYVATFLLLWNFAPARRALSVFAPAGRMALTNYLSHSAINYLLFFGFGLALLGRVGLTVCLGLTIAIYVLQILVSKWWLARWNFGPFEWLWRWWTHGARPPLRRVGA